MFVRLMRDRGLDFYWDDKYSTNLFARGFEKPQGAEPFDAVTSFESLEHFPEPMAELRQMFALTSTVIFTTELLPDPVPAPQDWWYYGLSHGQHIAFYSRRTFHHIAQVFQARYFKVGPIHVLTQSPRVRPSSLWASLCLAELGLDRGLRLLLKSKTWADYHRMEQDNAST